MEQTTVWSYAAPGAAGDALALYLRPEENGGVRLLVQAGGRLYPADRLIPVSAWSNITLEIQTERHLLELFYNEQEILSEALPDAFQPPRELLYIGKGREHPCFRGYLAYLAVFDELLDRERLSSYLDCPPFLLEKNLRVLCRFACDESHPADPGSFDGHIVMVEDTVPAADRIPDEIRLPKENQGVSDLELWNASALLNLLCAVYREGLGLPVREGLLDENGDCTSGALARYLNDNLLPCYPGGAIPNDPQKIAPEDTQDFFDSIVDNGFLAAVTSCLCIGIAIGASAALKKVFGKRKKKLLAGVGVALALMGTLALNAYAKARKKPVYYHKLSLASIQFCMEESLGTDPTGVETCSVPLRRNGRRITGPEWLPESTESAPVAYTAETVQPMLRVTLYYETNDPTPYSCCVVGQSATQLLGNTAPQSLTFHRTGSYTVLFSLPNHHLNQFGLGKFYERFDWYCGNQEAHRLLKTSFHPVFVLWSRPLAPCEAPSVELLEFLDTAMRGEQHFTAEQHFTKEQFLRGMQSGLDMLPRNNSMRALAELRNNAWSFDETRLTAMLYGKEGEPAVGPLDIAMAAAHLLRSFGVNCYVMNLSSGGYGYYDQGDCIPAPLALHHMSFPGGTPNLRFYPRQHWVVAFESANAQIPTVCEFYYHYYMDESHPDKSLLNLPYTTGASATSLCAGLPQKGTPSYRELVCPTGFLCCNDQRWDVRQWEIRAVTPQEDAWDPQLPTAFFSGGFLLPGFDALTNEYFGARKDRENLCHSVSKSYMKLILSCLVTLLLPGGDPSKRASARSAIRALKDMVMPGIEQGEVHPTESVWSRGADESLCLLSEATRNVADIPVKPLVTACVNLLNTMSNSLQNLRIGHDVWNQSIGRFYDPGEWYIRKGKKCLFCSQDLDLNEPHKEDLDIPVPPDPSETQSTWMRLYFTQETDALHLNGYVAMRDTFPSFFDETKKLFFLCARYELAGAPVEYVPLCYSSSNRFPFPQDRQDYCKELKSLAVYYLMDNKWNKW